MTVVFIVGGVALLGFIVYVIIRDSDDKHAEKGGR
jgi:hypothetical protein